MTNASISLQELRRKIYIKAKTDKHGRFEEFLPYPFPASPLKKDLDTA